MRTEILPLRRLGLVDDDGPLAHGEPTWLGSQELVARVGDTVWLDGVRWVSQRPAPYLLEQVETLRTGCADDESSSVRRAFQKARS